MTFFYLTSGLFLGWSLGANNAANIFATAVATKMVRFSLAALIGSIFVVLGAVISGAGAAHTYGELGSINALGGAFTAALAAGFTVSWMTKLGLPVSTTQAIVGAIIGWDFFAGVLINTQILTKIVSTWVICPILTGVFAYAIYKFTRCFLKVLKIHILDIDYFTRLGLILVGAFGAYSLGANNIANVMGVFVTANPFKNMNFFGVFTISGTQVLFLIGGLAITVGIYTYSHRVMKTVGSELSRLTPVAALIVVLAESLVLFIFASQSLERLLLRLGLPTIPLVPVSSSQAVVGGVVGIAVARGGAKSINYNVLGRIFLGWVVTPVTSGIIAFFTLFFMQNVFQQKVFEPIPYQISEEVMEKLHSMGIYDETLEKIRDQVFYNSREFKALLKSTTSLSNDEINHVIELSEIDSLYIDTSVVQRELSFRWFTRSQIEALKSLHGRLFVHRWQLMDALTSLTQDWKFKKKTRRNRLFNKELSLKYEKVFQTFRISYLRKKYERIHSLLGLK